LRCSSNRFGENIHTFAKSQAVAAAVLEAAHAQHAVLPGQDLTAAMVARLAQEVITLDIEIASPEAIIE
jgi:hypothetical protein